MPERHAPSARRFAPRGVILTVGWDRVRGNRGARTAGVDGVKPCAIGATDGEEFLRELRDDLKARRFLPDRANDAILLLFLRRMEQRVT